MWKWQAKGDHKIATLTLEAPNRYDPSAISKYSMYYQGWTWGACSCASLWHWIGIPQRLHNEETLAGFIKLLLHEVQPTVSWYNPRRVFAQVPAEGIDPETGVYNESSPWFEYVISNVYPDIKPVYEFRNRSHKSTMQRLFDLDTDQMETWLGEYNARQQKLVQEKPVEIVTTAAAGSNRTIILNNGGQRPIAQGEYFR